MCVEEKISERLRSAIMALRATEPAKAIAMPAKVRGEWFPGAILGIRLFLERVGMV
jgi:hypothetical protein